MQKEQIKLLQLCNFSYCFKQISGEFLRSVTADCLMSGMWISQRRHIAGNSEPEWQEAHRKAVLQINITMVTLYSIT